MHAISEVNEAFPWLFPTFIFVVGACIGSFLNVVIYRLPKNESVVSPRSRCACGAPIKWHDNIPIVSWLVLRGRARCCGRAFSFRYPFVELLTAALFLVCWLRYPPAVAACGMVFVSALIVGTFIDLDHFEIPNICTTGLGLLGVLLSFAVPALHGHGGHLFLLDSMRAGFTASVGLLIGSALLLWIALVAEAILKKEAMGFGDVTFVGAIGAFCGWQGAIFTIFGGALVGTIWFGLAFLWEKISGRRPAVALPSETPEGEPTPLGFGAHVPFGPMLAIAAVLYFLIFRGWVNAWIAEVASLFQTLPPL